MIRSRQAWLITGASSGFGREIALAVLRAGGQVVATARQPEALAPIASQWPDRCVVHRLDVTDAGQIAETVALADQRLGGIDVLVNNAGYGLLDSVEDASADAIRRLFEVNFFGALAMIRAVLPGMRTRGRGWIVNISSSGGRLSAPSLGYYSATKHALEGLSKGLRGEVEPLGIGVTVVEPGSSRTAFSGAAMATRERWPAHYADSVGNTVRIVRSMAGSEAGDPAKAASAIVSALDVEEPPRQLLLGSDAHAGVRSELLDELDEIDRWAGVSLGTSFEIETPS